MKAARIPRPVLRYVASALLVAGLALAAACHIHGGTLARNDCAWTTLNHSGVTECHLAGPPPDPPVTFMAVDTSSHLEL